MSWADYGFPDITMMPCYLPAKALQLAFDERATIGTGLGSVIAEEYTPSLFVEENGRHFTQGSDGMFGGHCWTIPGTYINHLLDLDIPVSPFGGGAPRIFWEEDSDIRAAIEAADTTGLGYLDPHMLFSQDLVMMPEWSKTWLEQRYLAMNLLKVAEVPFTVTRRHGNTGNNWFATPQLAHDYAAANSATEELPGDYPLSHLSMYTTIYESAGGGAYGCTFRVIDRVDVDYSKVPHLAGLPAHIYVSTSAGTIWDPGYTFDNHGFPIRDGEGIITKIPLPWESEGVARPVGGLAVGSFGYMIRRYSGVYRNWFWQYAGVDVSSRFQFYDDVDAIAAGAA
ncbi:MAG: hypothetical protein BWY76_02221 [bacterium ADurb.Bin429]|nr:MAG: hypothetical protein BWY76_02221 [bacterium ADurb.Bin429]